MIINNTLPAQLTTCLDEPVAGVWDTEKDVAGFILDLREAGQDCRDKLNAVRQLQNETKN